MIGERYKNDAICNVLFNEVRNDKISHAYLIEENDNPEAFKIVLEFVKAIICGCGELSIDDENICKRIDDGNYPELKIIEPDGLLIKKQQIINLQQEFSREALEGKKRVYIIRECEKMRPETANAMLKFLEEPDNDLVAILMTNNGNNILPTIISRCQRIKLSSNINTCTDSEYDEIVIEFIKNVTNNGKKVFINKDNFWMDKLIGKDRELMMGIFDTMIDMYYDMLKLKQGILNIKYEKYVEELKELSMNISQDKLLRIINYLLEARDSIKFNVNINLLMDSVVVNVGGLL